MSKATETPITRSASASLPLAGADQTCTSRRRLLAGFSGAALAGTALAIAAPSAADAELLSACAEYHRAHAEWHGEWESEDHGDDLCDARNEALEAVVAMEHHTPEGLRAKAAVAHCAMLFEANAAADREWRDNVDIEHVLAIDVLAGLVGSVPV